MSFTPIELSDATHLVELGVSVNQMPEYLFKYRQLNQFLDAIIENNQLWFSAPEEFNDPFDCRAKIDSLNNGAEIKSYVENNFKGLSRHLRRQKIIEWTKNPSAFNKLQQGVIAKMIASTGVCCFAGDQNNLLMWSHYASSHTGVCMKFEVIKDPEFFTVPLKVIYSDEYPVYNHLRDADKLIDKLIRTKSTCWSYEQELRVVKHLEKGLQRFNRKALVEIIFGCRVKKEEIERVKSLAKAKGYAHLKFTKCRIKSGRFGFDFIAV